VFNVAAAKKCIASAATRAIKKSAHNRQKKPWTEVSDSLPSVEASLELLAGFQSASDTKTMVKWELYGNAIHQCLGMEPYIHPVKFDDTFSPLVVLLTAVSSHKHLGILTQTGKLLVFRGGPMPKIHAWVAFETVQIKYESRQGC
jgi:hypothetical protein